MNETPRYPPIDVLTEYDQQAISGVLQIDGAPAGRIRIAPAHHRLSLLVEVSDNAAAPDVRDLANLTYETDEDAGAMWHRLEVTYSDNLPEVYPVLCAILDRVQLGGETFAAAVGGVLAGLSDILAGRGGLSLEKQVGLFGELVVLLSLAAARSPRYALASWRGPNREEHDFGLDHLDVEVKTTTSEQRSHWIGSLTQLRPTPGRDLHLLSIQITRAGEGAGATLPGVVDAVRRLADVPPADVKRALESAGYWAQHADLYRSHWILRSSPAFHVVDDGFPAITPERLGRSTPSPQRITDLRYRVNVDGLSAADPAFSVTLPGAEHI